MLRLRGLGLLFTACEGRVRDARDLEQLARCETRGDDEAYVVLVHRLAVLVWMLPHLPSADRPLIDLVRCNIGELGEGTALGVGWSQVGQTAEDERRLAELAAQQATVLANGGALAVTCPACGATDVTHHSAQTCSGDEGMTNFYECCVCPHRWS